MFRSIARPQCTLPYHTHDEKKFSLAYDVRSIEDSVDGCARYDRLSPMRGTVRILVPEEIPGMGVGWEEELMQQQVKVCLSDRTTAHLEPC